MAGTCKRQSELLESGTGELSLLPLFLDLKGKRTLVIGTSHGARWKAELLRATGALVQQLDGPPVVESALSDYSFVVADIADEEGAIKFAKEAQAAGVAYNMVDRPELCRFQFGAIVNRSPVIVSISTSGAAPVLAQTIRQRIESILPENLGVWGAVAKRLRARITQAIHDSGLRRAVWQRFAGLAMVGANPMEHDEHSLLASLLETSAHQRKPAVLEIPHERDLMTLRNCRMLMNADVVYDYSGGNFVKSLMRREAEYVGLDSQVPVEHHDDQNRNVVICVSAAVLEVWQRVIDVSTVQGYRHFP
ncbi:MAG TPA: NAD(P)-dependent oxidoreductase [Aestuariivirga sp.]|jgi:uroporphyrin-III C-methyltransferase/precorrin-2 dehydrogenase/sirohydrochlorin ferrochelatase|nr:NAD(P)-dependent oxidoreductase [Aestuariivirga sp.]